ncbi:MAG: lysophospholipid acyltransferase family protein [Hyphomicrobiales bacterium]
MDLVTPRDLLKANKSLKYFGGIYLARLLFRILHLKELNSKYDPISHLKKGEFIDSVIDQLGFSFEIDDKDLERIPKEGSFCTVHNHPYGGIDGILLMKILPQIREDYKILVNFLLTNFDPIEEYFLPVNPFESHKDVRSSLLGLKAAYRHLSEGHPLGIYPAGEVSSYKWSKGEVTDRVWQHSVLKFMKKAKVPIVPIYFEGHNSKLFQSLGMIHPMLRTLRLPAELFNKKDHKVKIRIGNPISVKDQDLFADINDYARFLRTKTYQLKYDNNHKKPVTVNSDSPIRKPVAQEDIDKEIKTLRESNKLLFELSDISVFCAAPDDIPNILQEIGRLREITFREVGEGTSKEVDLDKYDEYFEQIFIWDNENNKIVGGYRVGKGKDIMQKKGIKGFYINTLFKISPLLKPVLQESIELGRSFIIKEYQKKTFSLFFLWKGIIFYLLKNKEYRYLLGPASMSNEFSNISKVLTVEFLKENHYNSEFGEYIEARKPFKYKKPKSIYMDSFFKATSKDIGRMDRFIQDTDPTFRSPILFKKYLSLNAEILGFNVDPKFGDCLDALIMLDLFDVPMDVIESLSKEINDDSILERFKK